MNADYELLVALKIKLEMLQFELDCGVPRKKAHEMLIARDLYTYIFIDIVNDHAFKE